VPSWPSESDLTTATAAPPVHRSATPSFPVRDGNAFLAELRSTVDAYFAERQESTKAGPAMVVKTVVLLAMVVVPYALVVTNAVSPLAMLGLAVVIGFGIAGIGFAVAHDALHGSYTSSPRLNSLIGSSGTIAATARQSPAV
jgi:linoleoyl-CoA desaturase